MTRSTFPASLAVARKLDRQRREVARRPLTVLLQWIAARVVARYQDLPHQPWHIEAMAEQIRELISEVADAGALSYFGIRSAFELGEVPVEMYVSDDARRPPGSVGLVTGPIVEIVFRGGARGAGWRSPADMTADDLLPPADRGPR